MANAAAVYLTEIPTPRPDLVFVKMGVALKQKTTSTTLYIPQAVEQLEEFRQTIATVVALGGHVQTQSHWGTLLNVGDEVILAVGSGDWYLITNSEGVDEQYRFVSPLHILGKNSGV